MKDLDKFAENAILNAWKDRIASHIADSLIDSIRDKVIYEAKKCVEEMEPQIRKCVDLQKDQFVAQFILNTKSDKA